MPGKLTGLTDPEVKEAAEELVVKNGNGDLSPLVDGYRRYHTLSPFELRAVRDHLQKLISRTVGWDEIDEEDRQKVKEEGVTRLLHQTAAHHTFKAYAGACSHLLSWSEYDWNWEYIVESSENLRDHAGRVESAMESLPEGASCTDIFRRAMWYTTYDPERHQEAILEYQKDRMGRASDLEARIETMEEARDDIDEVEYRAARNTYRDAGWSGARKGGREELEELTNAILWTTKEK